MAAEDKDGSDSNKEYQKKLGRETDDKITSDEIYSKDKVLGFQKGNGSISDISTEESMNVISSNTVVWAIIILFFLIGLGVCILGYFSAVLINVLKAIWAVLQNENPDEAMDKVRTSKKSTRGLTFAIGEALILVSIVSFVIFSFW